jgi:hypothetical protein
MLVIRQRARSLLVLAPLAWRVLCRQMLPSRSACGSSERFGMVRLSPEARTDPRTRQHSGPGPNRPRPEAPRPAVSAVHCRSGIPMYDNQLQPIRPADQGSS